MAKTCGNTRERNSNVAAVVRWGVRLLRESPWTLVKCDKDAGMTIINKADVDIVEREILEHGRYRQVHVSTFCRRELSANYHKLAVKIAEVEESKQGYRAVMKSIRHKQNTRAQLKLTCKTHNPPGEVTFRAIHASPCWSLEGVAS